MYMCVYVCCVYVCVLMYICVCVCICIYSYFHSSSHYQIVVVSRDDTDQSYESLYPYSAPEWEPLGYYVTATFPADMDDTSFTVGDGTTTEYNGIVYENANLQTEVNYRIFIRVYSGVDDAVRTYMILKF